MQTPSIPAGSYICHGTLDVPRSAERAYEAAKAYLIRDPLERRLFQRLEHAAGGRTYRLKIDRDDNDYFDPRTNTIGWDPYSALRTTRGGSQSPALGLGHEVDHAVENPIKGARLMRETDRRFDTKEERRVILGSETHAARTLHEATRDDHAGDAYRVDGPTAMNLDYRAFFPRTGAYFASARSRASL